jgi:hypothetical protein
MPHGKLYRVFYCSRQTAEAAANLDVVVQQIIAASIRRNRSVGLTGLLLTVQGSFIQALEGDVDAVRETYARISMDSRHHDLRIVSQGAADRRLFGDWDMCARSLAPSDTAIVEVLDAKAGFNTRALTPASVERLLVTVAAIQRRTAHSGAVASRAVEPI